MNRTVPSEVRTRPWRHRRASQRAHHDCRHAPLRRHAKRSPVRCPLEAEARPCPRAVVPSCRPSYRGGALLSLMSMAPRAPPGPVPQHFSNFGRRSGRPETDFGIHVYGTAERDHVVDLRLGLCQPETCRSAKGHTQPRFKAVFCVHHGTSLSAQRSSRELPWFP